MDTLDDVYIAAVVEKQLVLIVKPFNVFDLELRLSTYIKVEIKDNFQIYVKI